MANWKTAKDRNVITKHALQDVKVLMDADYKAVVNTKTFEVDAPDFYVVITETGEVIHVETPDINTSGDLCEEAQQALCRAVKIAIEHQKNIDEARIAERVSRLITRANALNECMTKADASLCE